MKFSQRIGKKSVRESIQIESIDSVLENRLWNNFLNDFFLCLLNRSQYNQETERQKFCRIIWEDFFENRADEIPIFNGRVSIDRFLEYIKEFFLNSERYEKYDFIEFISLLEQKNTKTRFSEKCNVTLETESAAYRLVDNNIVSLTSEVEITEIEEAMDSSKTMKSVEIHLRTALEFLSDRKKPDYRNSIKESISAVEGFCAIMTGQTNATLGATLTEIESTHEIHGALKAAFSSLYGYTSDSGGIRHSLLEGDIHVTMEDAKFMLVSCSAFINYLKMKR